MNEQSGWHATPRPRDDCEARLDAQDRRITKIFDLMRLVVDELGVDASPADETVPMLRLIDGGMDGQARYAGHGD